MPESKSHFISLISLPLLLDIHKNVPTASHFVMSDPPATNLPMDMGRKKGDEKDVDGLIHVKEGYFRYIDVLFEWCKYMNPWQVSQLTPFGCRAD